MGARLDCGKPYINDCFCRVDKATDISSHATSCLDRLCTLAGAVQNDINTFLSIYNSYCAENGYTLEGAAAAPTPNAGGNGNVNGGVLTSEPTAATVTRVTYATVTAPSRSGAAAGEDGGTETLPTRMGKWMTTLGMILWVIW